MSLALIGLLYAVHPRLEEGWMAHAHYWLHTLGLVVFKGAFFWGIVSGNLPAAPVAAGASAVALGVLLFAAHVLLRLRGSQPSAAMR